jgi:hypothetical protein
MTKHCRFLQRSQLNDRSRESEGQAPVQHCKAVWMTSLVNKVQFTKFARQPMLTQYRQNEKTVTRPTLKYLFMVINQYNSNSLINTVSFWLCTCPCRSRHVVTCSCQSAICLSTVEVQGCLSLTSATSVRCRTLPDILVLLNLSEWVLGYISRFSSDRQTDSIRSGEPLPWHRSV